MMITAQLVKELRDKTGVGMMDCKRALVENNGDMEAAITWLREKGIAKAAKKADRIAAEGTCAFAIAENNAVVYELNCETDFAAKNSNFLAVSEEIGKALVNSKAKDTDEALEVVYKGQKVADMVVNATAVIGEKISLRRVATFEKTNAQVFGAYSHMQGKIVSFAILDGANEEVAKDVCMHVAAMNPKYLSRADVNPEEIEKEKAILTQEALNEGKPANIVEKMVLGRVQKYLKDICLVDQPFVKDPDKTVDQYVKANNGKIVQYLRLEVGEGIEKKGCDFAAEVMAAVNS
ncbi:MAG: translation elongation factor Ts [Bacilli bacterium]|nr:translation elongation factor Ts [Bacilli bacterium]